MPGLLWSGVLLLGFTSGLGWIGLCRRRGGHDVDGGLVIGSVRDQLACTRSLKCCLSHCRDHCRRGKGVAEEGKKARRVGKKAFEYLDNAKFSAVRGVDGSSDERNLVNQEERGESCNVRGGGCGRFSLFALQATWPRSGSRHHCDPGHGRKTWGRSSRATRKPLGAPSLFDNKEIKYASNFKLSDSTKTRSPIAPSFKKKESVFCWPLRCPNSHSVNSVPVRLDPTAIHSEPNTLAPSDLDVCHDGRKQQHHPRTPRVRDGFVPCRVRAAYRLPLAHHHRQLLRRPGPHRLQEACARPRQL